jgi:hypothetical protein
VLGELEDNAKAKCKKIQAQEFSFAKLKIFQETLLIGTVQRWNL